MKFGLVLASSGLAMAVPQAAQNGGVCAEKGAKVEAAETKCEGSKGAAYSKCMCETEDFFPKWRSDRDCLLKDETDPTKKINAEEHKAYNEVLDIASSMICSGTPTTVFKAIWTDAAKERNSKLVASGIAPAVSVPKITAAPSLPDAHAGHVGHAGGAQAKAKAGADAEAGNGYARARASAEAEAKVAGAGGSAKAAAAAEAKAEAGNGHAAAGAKAEAEANGNRISTSVYTSAGGRPAPTQPAPKPAVVTPKKNATAPTATPPAFTGGAAAAGSVATGLFTVVLGAAAAILAL